MIYQNNGFVWFEADNIRRQGLTEHAFSTRIGGVSRHPYQKLNLGIFSNDLTEKVAHNKAAFLRQFNLDSHNVCVTRQVHGTDVWVADPAQKGKGFLSPEETVEADAAITNIPGVILFTSYADCTPILFLDPVKKVVGVAHAGWKGTVGKIVQRTVFAMHQTYQSEPREIQVAIGPTIQGKSFEIDKQLFHIVQKNIPFWPIVIHTDSSRSIFLDLQETNRQLLVSAGVDASNIDVINHDTFSEGNLFFSHRRSYQGNTGRMGAFITLSPERV